MKTSFKSAHIPLALSFVVASLFITGCASSKISDREILVTDKLPRPHNILVFDFTTKPEDVPSNSTLAGQYEQTPQTAEQIAEAEQAGAQLSAALVEEIRAMGMPAVQAFKGTRPAINDIIIKGYFISIDEGNAKKRVGLGFGSGASKLSVAVEGFQMTSSGLRKLGSGNIDAGGGKAPGAAMGAAVFIATANPVGLIVGASAKVYGEKSGNSKIEGRAKQIAKEIAEQMKDRFQQQGWISQ